MSNEVRIESPAKDTYVLRNTSGKTLEQVMVDIARTGAASQDLPAGMSLAAGEGVEFHLHHHGGYHPPASMHVRWDGGPEWVEVPVQ
ncbi:hypothetical protein [Arthrobacter sp. Helios]|uniref:hypothetical protein n=1 Tax=Arthrobacter sp. Helios TaxID=2828862 RepID=UPI00205E8A4F|nr:hypothetical protein [Arthrobacter sp. Helios]UPO78698.1 hypothetical protein ArtHe_08620 [Arthrobacter sp. Helios]